MSLKDVFPGTYTAKAMSARFIVSPEKKTPGIEVCFAFVDEATGVKEQINWIGWLSEKAKQATVDTIAHTLGGNGNIDQVDPNGVFTDPAFIDYDKEISLVIEIETRDDGKEYHRVKWVNTLGGSGFENVRPEVVKASLTMAGFKGLFAAAKAKAPAKAAPKKPAPAPLPEPVGEEDLPY